jgi:hypothetical protein
MKLVNAVELMEANIKEPISQVELADYVDLSRRQLSTAIPEVPAVHAFTLLPAITTSARPGITAADEPGSRGDRGSDRLRIHLAFQQELQGGLRLLAERRASW